jgi:hypothetical protein
MAAPEGVGPHPLVLRDVLLPKLISGEIWV